MNKLLQNVVYGENGTGKGAAGYISNMKIYAKTGTSNDSNDLWFVGGTPYYVASCWCGYDTQQTIRDSAIAMKMWGAVMSKIHTGLEAKTFTDSKYAEELYYCTETGQLATDACQSLELGWYKKNTNDTCKTHKGNAFSSKEEAEKYIKSKEETTEESKTEEKTESTDNGGQ
mgnify:CR=1 FL=1